MSNTTSILGQKSSLRNAIIKLYLNLTFSAFVEYRYNEIIFLLLRMAVQFAKVWFNIIY